MCVKLEEMYIDVDKIETLGVFESNKEGYELGLLLNNERYSVYSVNGEPDEQLKTELQDNLRNILTQIIETKENIANIKTIAIPRPVIEQHAEPAKEQIND